MELTINGEKRDVPGIETVADLLAAFKIDHKILVVELNQAIIDKTSYPATRLINGDRLEIVHFVGGG